jgi:hypothetical protein
MFDWLRKKKAAPEETPGRVRVPGQTSSTLDPVETAALAAQAEPMTAEAVLGRWIELKLPMEQAKVFLGYAYLDPTAGLSAKGDRHDADDVAGRPTVTVRLPGSFPWRVLPETERIRRGLPSTPEWIAFFGPQPDPNAPWRRDPILRACTHPSFVNDVQVVVHDGEPRRTGRAGEKCWVRVLRAAPMPQRALIFNPDAFPMGAAAFEAKYGGPRFVYTGTLLNQPHKLTTVSEGDELRFVSAEGLDMGLLVTDQYLEECAVWQVQPCNKCGMADTLDPPSVMAKTRFPDAPADAQIQQFSSFCIRCGQAGMQMLSLPDDAARG